MAHASAAEIGGCMKEKWFARAGHAKPLIEKYHMDQLTARIVAGRIAQEDPAVFLDRDKPLFDPALLKNADMLVGVLREKLESGAKVAIVGDYDVDGLTSTAILYIGMKKVFPKADVTYRIPERIRDGYGFSPSIAEELYHQGVDTIITCDNGVSAYEAGDFCDEKGMTLLITDHHIIQKNPDGSLRLPKATVITNPELCPEALPTPKICGAFVAYQVIRLLYREVSGYPPAEPEWMNSLKGYAAIGTICDVMPLKGENRRLVYQGLQYLNSRPAPGISALKEAAGIKSLDPYRVGYMIGPMINAGGRLGDQNHFLSILISGDRKLLKNLSQEMYDLNKERQTMTDAGIQEGIKQLETSPETDHVKVVYLPDLHESIAGLVAGKLKEKLYRPVLVLTDAEDGLKGSARSIPGYSMVERLQEVEEFFSKMGGHEMAAGFTLKLPDGADAEARLEVVKAFSQALNDHCPLKEDDLFPTVYIDAVANAAGIDIPKLSKLEVLSPFGTENPRPLFAEKGMKILKGKFLGSRKNVLRLTMQGHGGVIEMVCFKVEEFKDFILEDPAEGRSHLQEIENETYFSTPMEVDVIYTAEIDTYYSEPRVKLALSHFRYSQK